MQSIKLKDSNFSERTDARCKQWRTAAKFSTGRRACILEEFIYRKEISLRVSRGTIVMLVFLNRC